MFWGTLALLAVYALSVGPVAKIFGNSPPPALQPAIHFVYAPLGYLNNNVKFVHAFYDWYAKLWGVSF